MKFLLFLLPVVLGASMDVVPTHLYEKPTEVMPAFCSLIPNTLYGHANPPTYDLVYSSFTPNPRKTDPVMRVEHVTSKFRDLEKMDDMSATDVLVWPNEVEHVPDGIFSLPMVWSAATGFFLTGKDDGAIELMDMTNLIGGQTTPVKLTRNNEGEPLWYYHRIVWKDMNGDNHKDIITERATGGGPSADNAQLVWLENPGHGMPTPDWPIHVLLEGDEDVHFRVHELPHPVHGTVTAIISSCFYSNKLTVVWSETNDWEDLKSINRLVVDTYGWYFDVEVVDLNMDGELDILATTWSQNGQPGATLAYEIPVDWQHELWPRHILQDGYKSFLLAGTGSPGAAEAFWPETSREHTDKPYIMVSGDDDGNVYVLHPNSEEPTNWEYTQTMIYDGTGTIGKVGVKDVDNDGFSDVFIPAYAASKLIVMTYNTDPK